MRNNLLVSALVVLASSGAAQCQSVLLTETPRVKDCSSFDIQLRLEGQQIYYRDEGSRAVKIAVTAEHKFVEKVLVVHPSNGLVSKVARNYVTAKSSSNRGGATTNLSLRPERAMTVAQRSDEGFSAYSLGGTVTRDEYDVFSEHFDTLCLCGLLPNKSVAVGETWKLANTAVVGLCQFDGLVSHELTGKLTAVQGEVATFTVTGPAKGIEIGTQIGLDIEASGKFDVKQQRIVALEWKQKDSRDQGPASPGFKADVVITLKRIVAEEPKELNDAALEAVPQGFEVPIQFASFLYREPKGRFELVHGRDWRLTGQTEQHTVFRLLERGDFVAQATVTPWNAAQPGQHDDPKEFAKSMLAADGFAVTQVLDEGEVKLDRSGWFVYRLSAQGQIGQIKGVQTYFLIASPDGTQAVVVFTMKETQVGKLGARDLTLVEGLTFPEKK